MAYLDSSPTNQTQLWKSGVQSLPKLKRTLNKQCSRNIAAPLKDDDSAAESFYCTQDSPLLNNIFGQYAEESIFIKKPHDCSKFQHACLKCFEQANASRKLDHQSDLALMLFCEAIYPYGSLHILHFKILRNFPIKLKSNRLQEHGVNLQIDQDERIALCEGSKEECMKIINCYNTPGCLGYFSPPCYPEDQDNRFANGICVKEHIKFLPVSSTKE
ncbi:hypothetical protein ACTXT7_003576 [Hymenolepis weldensis]